MEKVTSVKLGNHFDSLLSSLTNSGRYKNASEAIRAGLRLLEEKEEERQVKLKALRDSLQEGLDSGEGERSIDELWEEVKARNNEL